ncbi:MAG: type II toxin-antitoxin system PemK/MazF family toxin [Planctomycetes bacterium]|nr:type II toxin-antitoxin system PemK/MazF family toxin [Planctomycetota bacterium]
MKQYEIHIVNLDPTVGSEIRKTRPCVIVSPDEMNRQLRTVQVAPLTSTLHRYPWRVPVVSQQKPGMIALDQIRTVDKQRLIRRGGSLSPSTIRQVKTVLHEMLIV